MSKDSLHIFLGKHYAKRLQKALVKRNFQDAALLKEQFLRRYFKYMEEADFGAANERYTSYLNIYSGLAAYELLRENGFGQEEGIAIYDEMCALLRKVAAYSYRIADLLPTGFEIVVNSLKGDLTGEKGNCWETEILEDGPCLFEYKISQCLYYDTCKAHGYPEFTRVFCAHDRYAYDVLRRHTKFIRYSAIGEEGECCHDMFVNVKAEKEKAR